MSTGAPAKAQSAAERAQLVEAPEGLDAVNRMFRERRWSDGLPIVPPTQDRVESMLSHTPRDRHEIIARVAPGFGAATVERIAINAVMAGAYPQYLPVLIAAVDAVSDAAFNLQAIQATTNPVAVWLILNGPIATSLEVNATLNCLGQGSWANATLGRALRLILQNVGGALPGDMDRATHGQPGKISFCCAENEADSPWPALHIERGYSPQASTVTVVGAAGTLNMNTHAKDAGDIVRVFADSMAFGPSNDYWIGGEPWIIISPEHAQILARDGLDKAELKRRLWEASKMPAGRMAAKDLDRTKISRRAELGEIDAETLLPIATCAAEIGIMVAGGPGTHSVYVPTFGDTRSVTRQIHVDA